MKRFIISISVMVTLLLLSGCSSKVENKTIVTLNSGQISQGVSVNTPLDTYTFGDQFDKSHSLNDDVKKVIFVFTKATGHLMRIFLATKEENYLQKRDIDFIADVSGMPSIIFKMFALPDLKESSYSIMIIKDKEKSINFRNDKYKNYIMVISLEKQIVKKVDFVTNEQDLSSLLD